MKNHTRRFLILFALSLSISIAASAQAPKPDPGKLKQIAFVDDNFGTASSGRPSPREISYQVWITTDGVLHCKTGEKIKSASVKFTFPTSSSTSGGVTTSSGGEVSRKLKLNQVPKLGPDQPYMGEEYYADISADKYKQVHSITLSLTAVSGKTVDIKLVNKKIPAKIG